MAERLATCWCEEHMVRIPVEWIGVRTRTCGNSECRSPAFIETPMVPSVRKVTARAQCGTIDGYLWHIAHAAEACRPCRIAWGCASEREVR